MKKIFVSLLVLGMASTAFAGVKKVYVGSNADGRAQYVIECANGNSYSSINQHSDGYWYSYSSNMGDSYKNLSINDVASKKCN